MGTLLTVIPQRWYQSPEAALLLLPTIGFVDFDDERMIRTTDAIRAYLKKEGLGGRYRTGFSRWRERAKIIAALLCESQ